MTKRVTVEELLEDFNALWKAVEFAKDKLNTGYHFDYSKTRAALGDAHELCRPFYDKLKALETPGGE